MTRSILSPRALRVTRRRLDAWRDRWPCSTLDTGTAYFDSQGDLVDLSGPLSAGDVDGRELDSFANHFQSPALRAVRGNR